MTANAVWRASRARALPRSVRLQCAASPVPSSMLYRRSTPVPAQLMGQVRFASSGEKATDAAAEAAGATVKENAAKATETAETVAKEAPKKAGRGLKRTVIGTTLALSALVGYVYATDTRASVHRYGVVPLVRTLFPDAEDAHHFGVDILKTLYKYGLNPRERGNPDGDGSLVTEVFGYTLSNPIGISGGLDKHADIPDPLFEIGPAIVEVGGTTPLPQDGNPRPRVFRVVSQNAMINRYGLNSKGADHMAAVLEQRVQDFAYANGFGEHELAEKRVLNGEAGVPPGSLRPGKLLAVQVAKNKVTPDNDIEAIKRDYVYCVDRVAKYADILVVNVSSPNTPGLRDLQATAPLTAILKAVVGAAKSIDRATKPYVMVKVSPDEDADEQVSGICQAVWSSGVDGVIVGNTTNRRPDALPKGFTVPAAEQETLKETGGYSGPQLFDRTVSLVARYRAMLDATPNTPELTGAAAEATTTAAQVVPDTENTPSLEPPNPSDSLARKVIFASGGVTNGQQAQAVLDAGASVAMMYTAITYGGMGTVTRVKQEMREGKKQQ